MVENLNRRRLLIEAAFLRVGGETCDRCSDTQSSVREAARSLERGLASLNIAVTLIEHEVAAEDLPDSNTVLINGRGIEEWLGAERVSTDCPSCAALVGESACCSAVSVGGTVHESLTADLVMSAALIALGLMPPSRSCCG
jgi:hypothetical protein